MSQSHVVSGLISKHSELVTLMAHHASEVDRLDNEIKLLSATIKLFAPETDLRTLPPKRFVETNRIFRQGESNRVVLEVLREAGGTLNTHQVAQHIAKKKGLAESKVTAIRDTILDTLKRAEKRGVVRQAGKDGMAIVWELN